MNDKPLLVSPKGAQTLLGVGCTLFYDLVKLGNFPKSVNPLGRGPMYRVSELEEWVKNLEPES